MKKEKILVADDSGLVRDFLQTVLEGAGYAVETAENGVEAVMKACEWAPDCLVLDVEMPLMKGYQVSRFFKLNRHTRALPVIIHTTRDEDREVLRGFMTGADAFVTKDFDKIDVLLSAVRTSIDEPAKGEVSFEGLGRFTSYEDVLAAVNGSFDGELFYISLTARLAEIAQNISSPSETIEQVFSLLGQVMDFDVAGIYIDRRTEGLLITIEKNPEEDFYKSCIGAIKPHLRRLVSDISMKKIRPNRVRKGGSGPGRGGEVRSLWATPLRNQTLQHGLMFFASAVENAYEGESVGILERISPQAGMLIHNAVLFSDVRRMEERTRKIFERYVPRDVIKNFMDADSEALLTGERKRVAILFSDIRSFTTLSESMSPERVVHMLNYYFSRMVEEITANRGMVDKFIGDAILAVFGAPRQTPNNPYYAVLAGLGMAARLREVNAELAREGYDPIRTGIGIHFGDAIVGNIGSTAKMDYTVIGDSVNLASRLEGLTKTYGLGLLFSDEVQKGLEEYAGDIVTVEIDTVKARGKTRPTVVYTAFARGSYRGAIAGAIENFTRGYALYRVGSFADALEIFKPLAGVHRIGALYTERCTRLIENPPERWEGIYTLD